MAAPWSQIVIISYRHRFIFFAVPKTGTHSVRRALRMHLGPEDLEQVGLYGARRFPFPELAAIRHGHLSAREIAPVIGADLFGEFFKFAFVRNPYARFVSYCAFMGRESGRFEHEPMRFMKHIVKNVRPVDHVLYRPQSSLLVNAQGELAMDFIGRSETMQFSWDEVCARIGLPATILDTVNTSSHGDYRQYYDEELRDLVGTLYRSDLDLFNYEFETAAPQSAQDTIGETARAG